MTPIPESVWGTSQLARVCGVSLRTARRWMARKAMPAAVATLAAIVAGGDLGLIDEKWKGWRLVRGHLYAPDLAQGFEPGEVAAIPYVREQVWWLKRLAGVAHVNGLSGRSAPVTLTERRELLTPPLEQQVA